METKWLEDFISLAETRSFSRSAQLRHVTQPAFSRRIQSLEMLQALQSTRAMLRGHSATAQDVIDFAVPHTLAFTFFPAWVSGLREKFGPFKSRLIALNVHDAVLRLVEGSCDLLIAYHHSSHPYQLDPARYEMVSLGEETLAPYVRPDADGQPLHLLPGRPGKLLPYLGYAPGAYLGQMVDLILKESGTAIHFDRVYETDMAEGLKAMALEGHGVAFLPSSAVRQDLRARRLVSAVPASARPLQITMDVRVYREKPGHAPEAARQGARTGTTPRARNAPKTTAQALWAFLAQTTTAPHPAS